MAQSCCAALLLLVMAVYDVVVVTQWMIGGRHVEGVVGELLLCRGRLIQKQVMPCRTQLSHNPCMQ